MELSSEKLQLFERLYAEEGEVVRWGRNFEPPEFVDKELMREYCLWRHWNKEIPRMKEQTRYSRELQAKKQAEADRAK